MAAPRVEIDLDKIYHNAHELVTRLAKRGICVTGVTKATLGSIEYARTLSRAGVSALGDSRIESIAAMRVPGDGEIDINAPMTLIRSPMLSQVEQVVMYADMSCNTELEVIKSLSIEAQKQNSIQQVLLMVELGDLREGIMPNDLVGMVAEVLKLPNIKLKGIGTNLACRSGVSPDSTNMAKLSELADLIEDTFDLTLDVVSGGNSANIRWALDEASNDAGRVNDLRLGESVLLGCEALYREPIVGLHTDAITLVAEIIEAKLKPTLAEGVIAQSAFGDAQPSADRGMVKQAILAIGVQDIDPSGLSAPAGVSILGASSDHLIIESIDGELVVGDEVTFQLNYGALLRAMTSPFVATVFTRQTPMPLALAG